MLVVYVVLLACIVFAHILIYWLIKAGVEDSKKPAPLSARQRRLVAGTSCITTPCPSPAEKSKDISSDASSEMSCLPADA